MGALLVRYSTDYVFDDGGIEQWTEDAPTGPLSVYGRTKLVGKQAIRAFSCRHLILRTSWVYAARGSNFARTMLRLAAERDRLSVIDDQIGAPTGADLLADITAPALRSVLTQPCLGGTHHAVAGGHTSWHGYAGDVIEFARRRPTCASGGAGHCRGAQLRLSAPRAAATQFALARSCPIGALARPHAA